MGTNDGRIGHFDSSDSPDSKIFGLTNRANHKANFDLIRDLLNSFFGP